MDILVVGSGGREHALCHALSKSKRQPKLFCAPGNAGIAQLAECVPLKAEDIPGLVKWCKDHKPNLVVIGPEVPLCMGLADELIREGFQVFGPTRDGAQMEGSKDFTKQLLLDNGIPTAKAATFSDLAAALAYVRKEGAPIVVKADGLAAGKGVTVCETSTQAEEALQEAMGKKVFGEAGNKVVIEEFLDGEEASILAFVDGESIVPMVSAQDHKRIFDGDKGPNTGGMGAYSPAPVVTPELDTVILERIFKPTLAGLKKRGITYRGVLYAGLMITRDGPKVIEYNCRFGDPETQVVLPRLKTDFVNICLAVAQGKLSHLKIEWDERPAACVVMAASGYPGPYPKGTEIQGLEEAASLGDAYVYHAGTVQDGDKVLTSGGRVLCVTGLGDDIRAALSAAYRGVERIHFQGAQFRKDIGWRALERKI
ncbi:MAG TPA: phosphoribosylamine--glycine ligase [bacterium]|nr:phosphoribosylamine--glycine ligase [bacterium]